MRRLYELYNLTGNDHFKTAAEYFDETALFEQLAANKDVLNGKHANTTVPKLTGAMKRYTVLTENEEYYNALTRKKKTVLTFIWKQPRTSGILLSIITLM